MDTLKFKTNIKCGGCIAKVTPFLNEVVDKWNVDVSDPAKVLHVETNHDASKIIQAVEKAGFKAEKLNL